MDILTREITLKQSAWKQARFFGHRNYIEKARETNLDFQPSKLHRKKYVETTPIFRPAKAHRKKYVETTWIFLEAKLRRQKYVEATWIFRPAKLRRKRYAETRWTLFEQRNCIKKVSRNDGKIRRNLVFDGST